MNLVRKVIGTAPASGTSRSELTGDSDTLNMTYLALNFSHYVNGVSQQHGEVSQEMFSEYRIEAITNGVHAATWTSPPIQKLLDRYIPAWRADNFSLRYALSVPPQELWDAHAKCKAKLIRTIASEQKVRLDPEVFTIGFGRRGHGLQTGGSDLPGPGPAASKSPPTPAPSRSSSPARPTRRTSRARS